VDEQWGVPERQVDFYDVKKDVESLLGKRAAQLRCVAAEYPALHPGRSARLELDGEVIGWIGELHPRLSREADLAHPPVIFELDVGAIDTAALPEPRELSRQPVVVRDLSVWVNENVLYQDLLDTLTQTIESDATLGIVQQIGLFDVWRDPSGGGEKSMALHFRLQDEQVTLDDARVEECMSRLLQALVDTHGARQRA